LTRKISLAVVFPVLCPIWVAPAGWGQYSWNDVFLYARYWHDTSTEGGYTLNFNDRDITIDENDLLLLMEGWPGRKDTTSLLPASFDVRPKRTFGLGTVNVVAFTSNGTEALLGGSCLKIIDLYRTS